MIVLVTGARGTLGRRVVSELADRAHAVRAMSRRHPFEDERVNSMFVDLETGLGLPDAVDGVDAIVHCATRPRDARRVDGDGTRRLVEAATRVGRPHVLFPSVVGCDVIPVRYYRVKQESEEVLARSGLPWTVLRATQFHQTVWGLLSRLARLPVMLVPHDTRAQPLDPSVVARRLVETAEAGPAQRLQDIGGAHAYDARDLARSFLGATGRRRRILRVNYPGITGAALRAGGNLTPNRSEEGAGWNDFVAEKMGLPTG